MIKKANNIKSDLKLVLASTSPRREEILTQLNLKFTIVPSKIDESNFDYSNPVELVKVLAEEKASSVSQLVEDAIIIAADTVVVHNEQILGKPNSKYDAKKMLKRLSSDQHQVITGVAVLNSRTGESYIDYNITEVKMTSLTENEINNYVETGEPLDKAGAYAIQGFGGLFIGTCRWVP